MLVVPIPAKPAQTLTTQLGGQNVGLTLRQKSTGLYADVYVNSVLIRGGVICRNGARLIQDAYLGFVGDLAFIDTLGTDDPYWTGLGSRWTLLYLEASDL
jgi:hypothetical protein